MPKKYFQVIIILAVLLVVGFSVWQLKSIYSRNSQTQVEQITPKIVTIPLSTHQKITFSVPQDWNTFYNGDPALVNDLGNYSAKESAVVSISTTDSPITFTDLTCGQVNFFITEKNLITPSFIESQKQMQDQTFMQVNLTIFHGYKRTGILPKGEIPNKGDNGGEIYYLSPRSSSPEWNLVIKKPCVLNEGFEQAFTQVLNSLEVVTK